jgi:peptidoglycan-associated lipoprotein
VKFPVIYFSYDQCAIGTRERMILDKVAEYMAGKDGYGLIISGHCDERGSKEYNMALGEKRALAVKDYLVSKGISEDRLKTVSYGEERPAVEGHDEAAYAKNRRAELELAKIK